MSKTVSPSGEEVEKALERGIETFGLSDLVPLQGTLPLNWSEDGAGLSARMVDGIHSYLQRITEESVKTRRRKWKTDHSSSEAYIESVELNRERLRKIIGIVDDRLPVDLERFGTDAVPAVIAEAESFEVFQVRWPVLPNIHGEGLFLKPKVEAVGAVIALPDADWIPEDLVGLTESLPVDLQYARRLVENRFAVIIPTILSRGCEFSGHPNVGYCNLTHREWVYRQSFQMGRHVIGWEVQKVLSAVDWFVKQGFDKIGTVGYGEGGLLAFYSAAVDQRISAALVSGYFAPREKLWQEPIYRNVWSLLTEFGDAEIASLIAPRGLVVEYSAEPEVDYTQPDGYDFSGEGKWAAPGKLVTPSFSDVEAEWSRLDGIVGEMGKRKLISNNGKTVLAGSQSALCEFAGMLGIDAEMRIREASMRIIGSLPNSNERQKRQLTGMVEHVQSLLHHADAIRNRFIFGGDGVISPGNFEKRSHKLRQHLWEEVLGKITDKLPEPNPRTRRVYDELEWVGYDVVLDVTPEFFAWGILCIPKDITPGERRPVVVCQHGWEGLPEDTITTDGYWSPYYRSFTAELVKRGFVTFAPHNPYRGAYKYMGQQRKANPMKLSLGGIIAHQHRQILNFLKSLDFVDPQRISLYGLSYGGWTANRIPSVLEEYGCSICSACFNDWTRKIVDVTSSYSYMYNPSYEMPEWNSGLTFNNAEMAYMISPRPFMVERGSDDEVTHDSWVCSEYAKVNLLYSKLGIGDRTEIEIFGGGHIINGQGTFKFLHKWLDWPEPTLDHLDAS